MHLLIAEPLIGLLVKLGIRLPARFGGSTMQISRPLAIVAVVVTLLVIVTQVVDLGGLGDTLLQTLRAMHGG